MQAVRFLIVAVFLGGAILTYPALSQDVDKLQKDLQGDLKKNSALNSAISSRSRERSSEDIDNYADMKRKWTGYDYTRVTMFKVTDPSLTKRIEGVFSSGLVGYLRDTTSSSKEGRFVSTVWIEAYVAPIQQTLLGSSDPQFELVEIRVLKQVSEPIWDEEFKTWVAGTPTLQVFSAIGTQLKFLLDKDPTLSTDLLAKKPEEENFTLPVEPFSPPERGPYVVKDASELDQLSLFFAGFSTELHLGGVTSRAISPGGRITREQARRGRAPEVSFQELPWPVIDLSFFKSFITFTKNWNIVAYLGERRLGYPLWSSGSMDILVGYKTQAHLGVTLPIGLGHGYELNLIGPVAAKARQLNGVYGLAGDFELTQFFPFAFGGSFVTGKISKPYASLTDRQNFYYIPTAVQLYYPIMFKSNNSGQANVLQIRLGYQYHRVNAGHVVGTEDVGTYIAGQFVSQKDVGTIVSEKVSDENSPYVQIDYFNTAAANRYGISLQFYNMRIVGSAWLEIIPNTFWIEGLYAGSLRELRPWESPAILMFSPRFRFDLSSLFRTGESAPAQQASPPSQQPTQSGTTTTTQPAPIQRFP